MPKHRLLVSKENNRYQLALQPAVGLGSNIEADLLDLVKTQNLAFRPNVAKEQFQTLYDQGPVLFQVRSMLPTGGAIDQLGGIYVSSERLNDTITALTGMDYEVNFR
jgi:hypothetical protein